MSTSDIYYILVIIVKSLSVLVGLFAIAIFIFHSVVDKKTRALGILCAISLLISTVLNFLLNINIYNYSSYLTINSINGLLSIISLTVVTIFLFKNYLCIKNYTKYFFLGTLVIYLLIFFINTMQIDSYLLMYIRSRDSINLTFIIQGFMFIHICMNAVVYLCLAISVIFTFVKKLKNKKINKEVEEIN